MSIIGLDFETYWGVKYSLTQLSYEEYIFHEKFEILCVGVKVDDDDTLIAYGQDNSIALIREILPPGNEHVVIIHNALFDGPLLEWVCGVSCGYYVCTQAMSRLLWPQESNSLSNTAKLCFPHSKHVRKGKEVHNFKDKRLDDLSPNEKRAMGSYCVNDVNIMMQCYHKMVNHVPEDELYIISIVVKAFVKRPFHVDFELINNHWDGLLEERKRLVELSGICESVLKSPAKFGPWVKKHVDPEYAMIPSPTEKDPDKMKWPLANDADEFIDLQERFPAYRAVWQARLNCASNIDITRSKRIIDHSQCHTYNPDMRLGFALQTYGAGTTLRWSGTNRINGQNLPRNSDIRRSLLAPPGQLVVVHDQSNIESRILAWLSDEPSMLEIFATDGDLYCDFAMTVYRRRITKADDPTERFVGKVCTLALGYQAGAARLRRTLALGQFGPPLSLSLEECEDLVRTYRSRYWRIVHLWAEAQGVINRMMILKPGEQDCWRGLRVRKECIVLPNETVLQYPKLKVTTDPDTGREEITYWNGKYRAKLYGGKLIENICQALSRVIIAKDCLSADRILHDGGDHGLVALLVHDETVAVVDEDYAQTYFDLQSQAMTAPPAWCENLTLKVEGGMDRCYSK